MNITFQKLSITSGTEGPSHDAWSYSILTFENNHKKVELKQGLVSRLTINGENVPYSPFKADPFEDENFDECFFLQTGFTIKQFYKTYNRIRNPKNCPNCGNTGRVDMEGFPGESFTCCNNCGQIIDSHFDIGAVI